MQFFPYNDDNTVITIDEASELFNELIIDDSLETCIRVVPLFSALCRNHDHLMEAIADWTRQALQGKSTGSVPNSLILARGRKFVVRLNVWPSIKKDQAFGEKHSSLYAYGLPHNHNYTFLTGVVFGAGYETEVCEWLEPNTLLEEGAPVSLTPVYNTFVQPNGVYIYEKFSDIHVQLPPTRMTATLNLMLIDKSTSIQPQFIFDRPAGKVHSLASFSAFAKQVALMKIMRRASDGQLIPRLEAIAANPECSPYVRRYAERLAGPYYEQWLSPLPKWRSQLAHELDHPGA